MNKERRKYVRFSGKGDIFAALREGFRKVGKVSDISRKGMAFSYLSDITKVDSDDYHVKKNTQVDIFSLQKEIHLFSIPCRIVYEIKDSTSNDSRLVRLIKCGIHFGNLSKTQLDLLNFLINSCTIKKRRHRRVPEMLNNNFNLF